MSALPKPHGDSEPIFPLSSAQSRINEAFKTPGDQRFVSVPFAEHRTGTVSYCPIAVAVSEATGNDAASLAALAQLLSVDHPAVHALRDAARDYWQKQHAEDIAELWAEAPH